jgi:hypothetical protein
LAQPQVPLLLWLAAVIVIFGVSYKQLSSLQGPLASLDNAAHVLYRVARTRAYANQLAMADVVTEIDKYRALLIWQVGLLSKEYSTLMYGGKMLTQVRAGGRIESPQQTASAVQSAPSCVLLLLIVPMVCCRCLWTLTQMSHRLRSPARTSLSCSSPARCA